MARDAFELRVLALGQPPAEQEADSALSVGARMKSRNMLIASAAAIAMLAAGCSSGSSAGAAKLPLEKTSIVVDAFPAIDSAGLYIAQMDGLFAAQGLHVKIVPVGKIPPSTQDLIDGQLKDAYDITAGDYVTYIDNEVAGTTRLRIIAEASFLQPNVLDRKSTRLNSS